MLIASLLLSVLSTLAASSEPKIAEICNTPQPKYDIKTKRVVWKGHINFDDHIDFIVDSDRCDENQEGENCNQFIGIGCGEGNMRFFWHSHFSKLEVTEKFSIFNGQKWRKILRTDYLFDEGSPHYKYVGVEKGVMLQYAGGSDYLPSVEKSEIEPILDKLIRHHHYLESFEFETQLYQWLGKKNEKIFLNGKLRHAYNKLFLAPDSKDISALKEKMLHPHVLEYTTSVFSKASHTFQKAKHNRLILLNSFKVKGYHPIKKFSDIPKKYQSDREIQLWFVIQDPDRIREIGPQWKSREFHDDLLEIKNYVPRTSAIPNELFKDLDFTVKLIRRGLRIEYLPPEYRTIPKLQLAHVLTYVDRGITLHPGHQSAFAGSKLWNDKNSLIKMLEFGKTFLWVLVHPDLRKNSIFIKEFIDSGMYRYLPADLKEEYFDYYVRYKNKKK